MNSQKLPTYERNRARTCAYVRGKTSENIAMKMRARVRKTSEKQKTMRKLGLAVKNRKSVRISTTGPMRDKLDEERGCCPTKTHTIYDQLENKPKSKIHHNRSQMQALQYEIRTSQNARSCYRALKTYLIPWRIFVICCRSVWSVPELNVLPPSRAATKSSSGRTRCFRTAFAHAGRA